LLPLVKRVKNPIVEWRTRFMQFIKLDNTPIVEELAMLDCFEDLIMAFKNPQKLIRLKIPPVVEIPESESS